MATIALSLPVSGLPNSTEDPKVVNDLTLIQNVINGGLDGANVAATAGFVRLVPTTMGSNGTALAGTLVGAVPGVTVTLPAPAANIALGVYAGASVTGANPVTVSGTNIYGVGLSAASSFKLGVPIAAVVLQSDGANWYVVSGQQDTGWVAPASYGANINAGPSSILVRRRGDMAVLRGGFLTSGVLSAGATVFTLPAGFAPPAPGAGMSAFRTSGAPAGLLIAGASLAVTTVVGVSSGDSVYAEGLNYALT